MRDHAQSAQTVGAHVGDDRVSVAGVAAGPAQLFVQMQGAAGVLAVGSDRSDRVTRPTAVAEKVTTTSARSPPQPLNPVHRPLTTITTSTQTHHHHHHITPIRYRVLRPGLLLPDGWTWNAPTSCTATCVPVPPTCPSSRCATCRFWWPTTTNCSRTHGPCWPIARCGHLAIRRSLNVNAQTCFVLFCFFFFFWIFPSSFKKMFLSKSSFFSLQLYFFFFMS